MTNGTRRTIKLDNVARDCDCAEVRLFQSDLKPGETTDIEAIWDSGRRRGKTYVNLAVHYRQEVVSASGEISESSRVLPLRISAEVLPDYRCEPARIEFDPSLAGRLEVRFIEVGKPDFKITKAISPFPELAVTERGDLSLTLQYTPASNHSTSTPSGMTLVLGTNIEGEPEVSQPIFFRSR